jgi:Domain of unknown function (DUF4157)
MRTFAPTPQRAAPHKPAIRRSPIADPFAAPRAADRLSHPADPSERAADQLADQVLRHPAPPRPPTALEAPRAPADTPAWPAAGEALPAATRSFFEPRFGYDFSRLRIHTDAEAARSASALNAHAFTIGRDIVFAAGRFAPETPGGRRLLAHELAHIAQPAASRPAASGRLIQRQAANDTEDAVAADVEEERKRFEAAKRQHQDALAQAKTIADTDQARLDYQDAESQFAKAKEQQARASVPPQPTDALQHAGKTTRTTVGPETGDLMDAVLRQSNILRRHLSTKIKIAGSKFVIENSDPEFDNAYRTLHRLKPGSEEWNGTKDVRGFYHPPSDSIHLRPGSNYGQAVHESIHKFSQPGFRAMFGGFLDEGVTQYLADLVLEEQGLEKGRTLYDDNLKCARKLINEVANLGLVAGYYFDGETSLVTKLLAKYHVTSEHMHGKSDEWCKLFGAD